MLSPHCGSHTGPRVAGRPRVSHPGSGLTQRDTEGCSPPSSLLPDSSAAQHPALEMAP